MKWWNLEVQTMQFLVDLKFGKVLMQSNFFLTLSGFVLVSYNNADLKFGKVLLQVACDANFFVCVLLSFC